MFLFVLFQVLQCGSHSIRPVSQESDATVAFVAEDSPNNPGPVAMVSVPSDPAGMVAFAYRAAPALAFENRVPLLGRDSVGLFEVALSFAHGPGRATARKDHGPPCRASPVQHRLSVPVELLFPFVPGRVSDPASPLLSHDLFASADSTDPACVRLNQNRLSTLRTNGTLRFHDLSLYKSRALINTRGGK